MNLAKMTYMGYKSVVESQRVILCQIFYFVFKTLFFNHFSPPSFKSLLKSLLAYQTVSGDQSQSNQQMVPVDTTVTSAAMPIMTAQTVYALFCLTSN